MRSAVLPLTMVAALAVTPALAQTTTGQTGLSQDNYSDQNEMAPAQAGGAPPILPAPPSHQPMVHHPTHIIGSQTRGVISPSLPPTGLGPNATATEYLAVAESSLDRNHTGVTQAALENAETYLLNRSVPQGMTNQPIQSPAIATISSALQSLAVGDRARTRELIRQAMQEAQQAQMAMQSGGMQAGMTGMPPGQPGMNGMGMQTSMPPQGAAAYPPPPPPNMQPGMGYPPPPPPR